MRRRASSEATSPAWVRSLARTRALAPAGFVLSWGSGFALATTSARIGTAAAALLVAGVAVGAAAFVTGMWITLRWGWADPGPDEGGGGGPPRGGDGPDDEPPWWPSFEADLERYRLQLEGAST
ncbi:MAG: hypothetical protein ACRD0J_02110 [Acidimicrobiales bacterium]